MMDFDVGTTVWFYNHNDKRIYCGTLIGLPNIRDKIGYILKTCNVLVRETRDNGDEDYIHFTICKDELFPTREALCEHYRKIFE